MMNSETKRPRQTIKMTIQKSCMRPPTTGAKTTQHQNRSNRSNEFHSTHNGNFRKKQHTIKTSLRHNPDGCVINLSKHSFSKGTYKLLSKNLSFTPLVIYSTSKLNNELQNFYHLVKLKAYFKDTKKLKLKKMRTQ